MTNSEIIVTANKLGIKPTQATPGTEIWQCWADRVEQAAAVDADAWRKLWDCEYDEMSWDDVATYNSASDQAIAEANRYAV